MHPRRTLALAFIALGLTAYALSLRPQEPPKIEKCKVPTPSAASRGDPKLRAAGHKGLTYLAKASREWTRQHQCFGCHVQAVTMEALSAGQHHQFDIGADDVAAMVRALEMGVTAGGRVTGAAFQGAAWARYDRWSGSDHTPDLLKWADALVALQAESGAIVDDDARRPVTGGTMQTTFGAAQTWRQAHARTADEKWLLPLRRAETFLFTTAAAWKDSGEGADLQDINFALLGLVAAGSGPSEASVVRLTKMLNARQNTDGGWSLDPKGDSDAFATGQTIYALELAGHGDERTARGLGYLLSHQGDEGSWRTYRSGQGGAEKGETMWAVLGLVTVDVANIKVDGLVDGQHVHPKMPIVVKAEDNSSGGIAKIELTVDDLPLRTSCGDALTHSWDTADLSEGMHVVDVVATNAKGQESRRRYEVYAGNVHLTHVAADFDESAGKSIVTLRSINPEPGAVSVEIWSTDESGAPKAKVYSAAKPSSVGPMSFDWAGLGDDGVARPRGRYVAKIAARDSSGVVRQSESALFTHDSESAQKAQFGEVEGNLSLKGGALASSNTIVELVDDQGKVVQSTRTTEQGNYRFKNVNEGGYKVRTRKGGFADLEQSVSTKANAAPAKLNMKW